MATTTSTSTSTSSSTSTTTSSSTTTMPPLKLPQGDIIEEFYIGDVSSSHDSGDVQF